MTMQPNRKKIGARFAPVLLAGPLLFGTAAYVHAQDSEADTPSGKVLRVCEDPSNMPFSNKKRQGFENKIAALFGKKLGVPVKYDWSPEQFGFARRTLMRWLPKKNRYACDLVMSVGNGFDAGRITMPYYRSTYVMTYLKGHGLDSVKTPADLAKLPPAKRKNLKIGVFAGSPVANWLLQHDLDQYMVSYQAQSGRFIVDPSDMVTKGLVKGKINVAMVWGPIGGYYAKHVTKANIVAIPFTRKGGTPYDFPVSMGVRYGEERWYLRVQQFVIKNHKQIMAILKHYGIPTVPLLPADRKLSNYD
jgi:quinoprotein dehydrogenase-associated probable ABC transporter substrate-binding protein